MKYDYLIVGAGLFGSVFAYEASQKGKTCLVIDKRSHLGGNVYNEKVEGINVHAYGPHIFHTDNKFIWDYINQFSEFNNYINQPIANFQDEIYNLPFNMNTFSRLWNISKPDEAKKIINMQREESGITEPKNLEEQAIFLIGRDIYEKLIKGYTKKQWGKDPKELPASIIKRLPVRYTYDNNYFNDRYQGIPIGGYNAIIDKMLENCDVILETEYFSNKDNLDKQAQNIVFTGMIDEYYGFKYGKLDYRSLKFESTVVDTDNYQANAVVNYTDETVAYTRIIEHKYFEFADTKKTVITKEYPQEYRDGLEPYYPINDEKNMLLYNKYKALADCEENVIFGGRLGQYKYYDMDDVILSALSFVKEHIK